MNAIQIMGRMVRDAEVRETKSGKKFAKFTVAVERSRKDAEGKPIADFINCKVWNGAADYLSSYCPKGTLVTVQGELHIDSYTDKDGNLRNWTEIAASHVTKVRTQKPAPVSEAVALPEDPDEVFGEDAEPMVLRDAELPF